MYIVCAYVLEYKRRRLYLFLHSTQIQLVASLRSFGICKHMQVCILCSIFITLKKIVSAFNEGDDYDYELSDNNGSNKFSSFNNEVLVCVCQANVQHRVYKCMGETYLHQLPPPSPQICRKRKLKFASIDKYIFIYFFICFNVIEWK